MRESTIKRETKETSVELILSLDQSYSDISTGIGFLDHMLDQVAKHGNIGLKIKAHGDLEVDSHHTIEDVAICFGKALNQCLGDFTNINRYGNAIVPMDEALVLCALDLCNRGNASIDSPFTVERVGNFDTEMIVEFFKGIAYNANINIHILVYRGVNNHHIIEGMFKSFGRALKEAIAINKSGTVSTKGVL